MGRKNRKPNPTGGSSNPPGGKSPSDRAQSSPAPTDTRPVASEVPTNLAPQQLTQQLATKLDVRLLPLIIVASISGTMNWASFWLFQGLVWIGLVPLVVLIKLPIKRWKVYFAAYVGGLCWFVPAMSWLRFTADEGWIAWLLMGFYLAVYYPLFILLARILHRGLKLPMTLAFPIAWTVIEYARMHMLSGMGWFLLAHSIYDWTSTIQIADLGGVYAVSFLVALVNGWWADLLSQPLIARPATTTPTDSTMSAASKSADDTNVRLHPGVIWRTAVMLVMMMANSYYGKYRLDEFQTTTKPGPTVGLVQINLPQSIKNGDSQQTWDHVWAATRPLATSNVDFVVWPETCYPGRSAQSTTRPPMINWLKRSPNLGKPGLPKAKPMPSLPKTFVTPIMRTPKEWPKLPSN